jgi:hypothetical protein
LNFAPRTRMVRSRSPAPGRATEVAASPQRLRKASQTARGFNGSGPAPVHPDGVRQELSAKADIAGSEPRIHSPGGWGSAAPPRNSPVPARCPLRRTQTACGRSRRRRPTLRGPSREFIRRAAGAPPRRFASHPADWSAAAPPRNSPVPAPGHSDGARQEPSAKADITFSVPRFQSPGARGMLLRPNLFHGWAAPRPNPPRLPPPASRLPPAIRPRPLFRTFVPRTFVPVFSPPC